jgi:hypothetical protein
MSTGMPTTFATKSLILEGFMNYYLYVGFNLSIFIAGIIGLVRFTKIDPDYYPFLFCLWIGCVNELLSVVLIANGRQTLVNNNIYVLVESLMLTWFFKRKGLFKKRTWFPGLILAFTIFWTTETLIRGITSNSTYFRIFYSFAIVIMSIDMVNEIIFTEKKLARNSLFLLCVCFIVYFTYKALLQAFVLYGVNRSSFLLHIYVLLIYVNLGVNLIFALAVLWMPQKMKFIRPYYWRRLL